MPPRENYGESEMRASAEIFSCDRKGCESIIVVPAGTHPKMWRVIHSSEHYGMTKHFCSMYCQQEAAPEESKP